jgi:putative endonuclease
VVGDDGEGSAVALLSSRSKLHGAALNHSALWEFPLPGYASASFARRFHAMARTYCVYIVASRSRSLYIGVTNNVMIRIGQHRERLVPGFTSRYRISRLVYFEVFGDIRLAIAREKEIKGWRREKKIWLVEKENPHWSDLAAGWFARK